MSQSFAEALSRVALSRTLGETFRRAHDYAHQQAHRRLSLEHLVLALCEDQDAALVLQACSVDIQRLATDASQYIGRIEDRLQPGEPPETAADPELLKILEYAAAAAHQSRRREINGAIVLAAIVGEGRSPAAQMLRSQGLTFEETIKALQRATVAARQQAVAARPPAEPPPPPRPALERVQPPRQGSGGATPSAEEILASVRERINAGRTQPPASRLPPKAGDETARPEPAYEPVEEQAPPAAYDVRPPMRQPTAPQPEARPAAVPPPIPPPVPAPPPAFQPPGGRPAGHAPPQLQRPHHGAPPPLPSQAPPQLQPPQGWVPPPQPQTWQPDARRAPPPRPAAALPPLTPVPPPMPDGQHHGRSEAPVAPPWPEPSQPPARGRSPPPPDVQRPGSQLPVPVGRNTVDLGQLVENVPRFMRVGIPEIVEVRIARADLQNIAVGMEGRGAAFRHDLVVTRAMSVKLRAPDGGMWIETASPETQWIESRPGLMSDDFASWRWTVLPERRGRSRLQLVASARTVGTDGLAAETALPDQMIEVRVGVNFGRLAARWGGWAIAAIVGGALAKFGQDAIGLGLKLVSGGA